MHKLIRVLLRLANLGAGTLRVAGGRAQADDARATVLSSDVFATLIARNADDDAARRAGTLTFVRLVREAGLAPPPDIARFRAQSEASLRALRRHEGRDPEFTLTELFSHMGSRLGVPDPTELGSQAASAEAGWERHLTRPVEALRQWYQAARREGRRIIAISDTSYSVADLRAILAEHGYDQLAEIYSSADFKANKFSGRLFEIVAEAEGVAPGAISHRGDSLPADVLRPAALGLGVKRIPAPAPAAAAAALPTPPSPDDSEGTLPPTRAMGLAELGPVFAAFARLLLAQAFADGVNHLAFVARDGDLAMQVTRILAQALPRGWRPRISYVYLSRRGLEGALDTRGAITEHGSRVMRYLTQAGVLDARTALVDIGWRGSTRDLIRELARCAGTQLPRAYYLGLWNEDALPAPDERVLGILCDQRRGRGPGEGAAWYAALLLEGVARAGHGTVIGYTETSGGQVRPVLADAGIMREAEVSALEAQREVRRGVLDYARALACLPGIAAPPDPERTRRAAQTILFRLAFFPNRRARGVGRRLVHSESTDDFIASLVQAPGSGLAGRLRQLRSPWKGAGFVEAGGWLAGLAYLLVEASFCYLPLGLKTRLRDRLGPPPSDAPFEGVAP